MTASPLQTLLDLAETCERDGATALEALYGADPVLVVKASRTEGGALVVSAAPADADWEDSGKTESGGVQSPFFALAEGSSLVVPVVKTAQNPFAGTIVVGRGPSADLRFTSSSVSKIHAFLRREGDGWIVQDKGSTNGTQVNGQALEHSANHPLNMGDELRFGDVPTLIMDVERLATLCSLVRRD